MILINLQNSSWNDKDSVNFCFNIGISLSIEKDKLSYLKDVLDRDLKETAFLTEERRQQPFRKTSSLGYEITGNTDMDVFTKEFEQDWKGEILPLLESLKTLQDWKLFYQKSPYSYIGPIKEVLDKI